MELPDMDIDAGSDSSSTSRSVSLTTTEWLDMDIGSDPDTSSGAGGLMPTEDWSNIDVGADPDASWGAGGLSPPTTEDLRDVDIGADPNTRSGPSGLSLTTIEKLPGVYIGANPVTRLSRVSGLSCTALLKLVSRTDIDAAHDTSLGLTTVLNGRGVQAEATAAMPLDELHPGWSGFTVPPRLTAVKRLDPMLIKMTRRSTHQFNQGPSAESLADHDPDRGLLGNDSMFIIAPQLGVIRSRPKPVSRMFVHYFCRKETGFVGLQNQGATCYLNSIIQTLYHVPLFRKAVYCMPTSRNDLITNNLPLALQSLFYKIQYDDTSPGTEDLTTSVGWDPSKEEDAHELNMFLLEKLVEHCNMNGTAVDGTIQQLFEGHFSNYIECIHVQHKSIREETFKDLQLLVRGCKDVYNSLDKYVEVEKLEGDNQYSADEFGFQDARRGVKFIAFPPVLQLHLRRFEYDFNRGAMVKTNDRYEFPLQLDLDTENGKYLSPDADRSVRNLYTLHSVLVHSGASAEAGHYYAFIRPTLSDQWYKFNDELVTKEESKTVLEEHCGGDGHRGQSNAYMLLYIRESDKSKVLCPIEEEDIPEHVQEGFE